MLRRATRVWRPGTFAARSCSGGDYAAVVKERDALRARVEELEELKRGVGYLVRTRKNMVGFRKVELRPGAKGLGAGSRKALRPSPELAQNQPAHVSELGHESLAELALQGNHSAHRERLLREIMCVEQCSWEDAHTTLTKMDHYKERYYWLESMPHRLGITGAACCAAAAFPMVFYKPVAGWYNEHFVGNEVPEDFAAMSINQVGEWTWNWMEPMLGTVSFFLVCSQFIRAQLTKMNMKPYTDYVVSWRADRLAKKFPEYDRSMTRAWAKVLPPVNAAFFPVYENTTSHKGPSSGL